MSDRPAGRRVRVVVLAMAVAAVAGVGFLTWSIATSGSPERRAAAARDLAAGIEVSVGVHAVSHRATLAIADFGIEEGVRLVPVRILDEIQLELRLESNVDVALAEPPRVCLVGPHWAPDDAGLSDRCWGEPDLGALLAAQLEADAAGSPATACRSPGHGCGDPRARPRALRLPGWRLDAGDRRRADGGRPERGAVRSSSDPRRRPTRAERHRAAAGRAGRLEVLRAGGVGLARAGRAGAGRTVARRRPPSMRYAIDRRVGTSYRIAATITYRPYHSSRPTWPSIGSVAVESVSRYGPNRTDGEPAARLACVT